MPDDSQTNLLKFITNECYANGELKLQRLLEALAQSFTKATADCGGLQSSDSDATESDSDDEYYLGLESASVLRHFPQSSLLPASVTTTFASIRNQKQFNTTSDCIDEKVPEVMMATTSYTKGRLFTVDAVKVARREAEEVGLANIGSVEEDNCFEYGDKFGLAPPSRRIVDKPTRATVAVMSATTGRIPNLHVSSSPFIIPPTALGLNPLQVFAVTRRIAQLELCMAAADLRMLERRSGDSHLSSDQNLGALTRRVYTFALKNIIGTKNRQFIETLGFIVGSRESSSIQVNQVVTLLLSLPTADRSASAVTAATINHIISRGLKLPQKGGEGEWSLRALAKLHLVVEGDTETTTETFGGALENLVAALKEEVQRNNDRVINPIETAPTTSQGKPATGHVVTTVLRSKASSILGGPGMVGGHTSLPISITSLAKAEAAKSVKLLINLPAMADILRFALLIRLRLLMVDVWLAQCMDALAEHEDATAVSLAEAVYSLSPTSYSDAKQSDAHTKVSFTKPPPNEGSYSSHLTSTTRCSLLLLRSWLHISFLADTDYVKRYLLAPIAWAPLGTLQLPLARASLPNAPSSMMETPAGPSLVTDLMTAFVAALGEHVARPSRARVLAAPLSLESSLFVAEAIQLCVMAVAQESNCKVGLPIANELISAALTLAEAGRESPVGSISSQATALLPLLYFWKSELAAMAPEAVADATTDASEIGSPFDFMSKQNQEAFVSDSTKAECKVEAAHLKILRQGTVLSDGLKRFAGVSLFQKAQFSCFNGLPMPYALHQLFHTYWAPLHCPSPCGLVECDSALPNNSEGIDSEEPLKAIKEVNLEARDEASKIAFRSVLHDFNALRGWGSVFRRSDLGSPVSASAWSPYVSPSTDLHRLVDGLLKLTDKCSRCCWIEGSRMAKAKCEVCGFQKSGMLGQPTTAQWVVKHLLNELSILLGGSESPARRQQSDFTSPLVAVLLTGLYRRWSDFIPQATTELPIALGQHIGTPDVQSAVATLNCGVYALTGLQESVPEDDEIGLPMGGHGGAALAQLVALAPNDFLLYLVQPFSQMVNSRHRAAGADASRNSQSTSIEMAKLAEAIRAVNSGEMGRNGGQQLLRSPHLPLLHFFCQGGRRAFWLSLCGHNYSKHRALQHPIQAPDAEAALRSLTLCLRKLNCLESATREGQAASTSIGSALPNAIHTMIVSWPLEVLLKSKFGLNGGAVSGPLTADSLLCLVTDLDRAAHLLSDSEHISVPLRIVCHELHQRSTKALRAIGDISIANAHAEAQRISAEKALESRATVRRNSATMSTLPSQRSLSSSSVRITPKSASVVSRPQTASSGSLFRPKAPGAPPARPQSSSSRIAPTLPRAGSYQGTSSFRAHLPGGSCVSARQPILNRTKSVGANPTRSTSFTQGPVVGPPVIPSASSANTSIVDNEDDAMLPIGTSANPKQQPRPASAAGPKRGLTPSNSFRVHNGVHNGGECELPTSTSFRSRIDEAILTAESMSGVDDWAPLAPMSRPASAAGPTKIRSTTPKMMASSSTPLKSVEGPNNTSGVLDADTSFGDPKRQVRRFAFGSTFLVDKD